jgi:hypothetical protein
MNKKKFIPSLLLSFLIHLGVLTGIDVFLAPTPGMPEWPDLIPVDMVIIEEKEEGSQSDLTLKKTEFPKDPLIAKAETAKGTPSTTPVEDFPGPIPKEGTFKPSLNVEQIPTPGVLPPGQEGKEVQSRRVVSRSLSPPQHLPEIPPSPSDQTPLLEVEEPRVLTLAEKGGIPTESTTLEKITAPLGRNRPHPEFVSDLDSCGCRERLFDAACSRYQRIGQGPTPGGYQKIGHGVCEPSGRTGSLWSHNI